MNITPTRIDPWRLQLPKVPPMRVPALIYSSEKLPLEATAVSQHAFASEFGTVPHNR